MADTKKDTLNGTALFSGGSSFIHQRDRHCERACLSISPGRQKYLPGSTERMERGYALIGRMTPITGLNGWAFPQILRGRSAKPAILLTHNPRHPPDPCMSVFHYPGLARSNPKGFPECPNVYPCTQSRKYPAERTAPLSYPI